MCQNVFAEAYGNIANPPPPKKIQCVAAKSPDIYPNPSAFHLPPRDGRHVPTIHFSNEESVYGDTCCLCKSDMWKTKLAEIHDNLGNKDKITKFSCKICPYLPE